MFHLEGTTLCPKHLSHLGQTIMVVVGDVLGAIIPFGFVFIGSYVAIRVVQRRKVALSPLSEILDGVLPQVRSLFTMNISVTHQVLCPLEDQ
jgi:hypothetical protein